MEFRECDHCSIKKELSFDNFRLNRHGNFLHICRDCESKSAVKRRGKQRREQKLMAVGMLGGKCIICGYNHYIGALTFHHLDPLLKETNIGILQGGNFDKLKKELEKCILVCRNCHEEIHNNMHPEYLINYSFVDFNPNFISLDKAGPQKRLSNRKGILKSKKMCIDYLGSKCCLCNYDNCERSLHFHHVNPNSKDFSISDKRGWKFETLKPELDKCILVCGNCHAEIHAGLHLQYLIVKDHVAT